MSVMQDNPEKLPQPNKEHMRRHIEFIMQGMGDYKDGMIEISYGDEINNDPDKSQLFTMSDENAVNDIIDYACLWNINGRNVYIVPAYQLPDSRPDWRGNSDQFYATTTLALDIDNDKEPYLTKAQIKLRYAPCKPGVVIISGQKPNLRTWLLWKLMEPITDKALLRNAVSGVIQKLDGDRAAKDATRLTRLGGSVAWATGKKAKIGRIHEVVETLFTNEPPVSIERIMSAYPYVPIKPRKATGLNLGGAFERDSPETVRDMLSFLSEYDGSRDEWLAVGMALNDGSYEFDLFNEWSAKSKTKYDYDDCVKAWNSFKPGGGITMATVAGKARDNGWLRVSEPSWVSEDLSTGNTDGESEEAFFARKAKETGASPPESPKISPDIKKTESAPANQIKFTGLIGDTIDDILNTAQKPQPELAMLNVLTALGALYGRTFCSPMDTRTNLYTVGIASTAAGKDHSRKYIKSLLFKNNMETFLGDDSLVSGAGLLASVAKKPSQIMHIDEFGMVLADIKSKNTGSHMKICAKILTELYSASNSHYFGGQYADPKRDPVKIQEPNLCIYGTTTLEKYIEAMDRSVIASGELNRYIIIKPEIDCPTRKRGVKISKPSPAIANTWATLAPSLGANSLVLVDLPKQVTWDWLDEDIWNMQVYQDEMARADPVTGALWGRYAENSIKIAMIMAISRSHQRPNIEKEDLNIAAAVVAKSIKFMTELANTHMYDSEIEKMSNRILDIVKKCGPKMPQSLLTDRTREMRERDRAEAIEALSSRLAIKIEKEDTGKGGRPRVFLTAL